MPQATQELRDEWGHDNNMDELAITHLKNRGFIFDRSGIIHKPSPDFEPSEKDYSAIDYLFQEWDYGYDDRA